jgi:CheY-like chemotaxis protein
VIISCDAGCIKSSSTGQITADVTVSIEDEGAGISPEDQAKLFNMFVQIRPGTIQKGQGSGLGLSFCKQMVEFHGGVIGVQSKEGHGSRFAFTIPFPIYCSFGGGKDSSIRSSTPCASLIPRQSTQHFESKDSCDIEAPPIDLEEKANLCVQVLVVDDTDSNRKMLVMLLKQKGLTTEVNMYIYIYIYIYVYIYLMMWILIVIC